MYFFIQIKAVILKSQISDFIYIVINSENKYIYVLIVMTNSSIIVVMMF